MELAEAERDAGRANDAGAGGIEEDVTVLCVDSAAADEPEGAVADVLIRFDAEKGAERGPMGISPLERIG